MGTALTAQRVMRIKPDLRKRLEIPDAIIPGLYLVVQQSGVKSWGRSLSLPRANSEADDWPVPRFFDLVSARAQAREALQSVALGRDPCREQRERRRAKDAAPHRDLVLTHVESFLARYVRPNTKPRTAAEPSADSANMSCRNGASGAFKRSFAAM